MLTFNVLSVIILGFYNPSVSILTDYHYAEFQNPKCQYAECQYDEFQCSEYQYAECQNATC